MADKMFVSLMKETYNNSIRFFNDNAVSFSDNLNNYAIIPGFCDVHVHFREPGFVYKENIQSGISAAVRGGYTAVCTMPNLNPVPDTLENISVQLDAINKVSLIPVYPYASITTGQKGEQLSELLVSGYNAVGYSDDGKGVQSEQLILMAMQRAKEHDKIIVAHCEDESLLNGGYIHKGEYATKNGHLGIPSESEYSQLARDVELIKRTGCKYHVCHISTKESVQIIRDAKKRGLDITCETAPHYLILCDEDIKESGNYKMNPPLRSKVDREALIDGIKDGTIDMIATDHAPHSLEEKSKGLKGSLFGIVGLETAFPALYTNLVKTNVISLQRLIELMCINPRKRFNIKSNIGFSVWNLEEEFTVDPNAFHSKGKSTPFEGMKFLGVNKLTVYGDRIVYKSKGDV